MQLTINGNPQTFPDGIHIPDVLTRLKAEPALVAVEVNRELVPRRRHGETTLCDGDVLEIVTLVGGG